MELNEDKLVKISVVGQVRGALMGRSPYDISAEGQPLVKPGVGGVTYNVRVGDKAVGLEADHVEPGVTITNKEKWRGKHVQNHALNTLTCIGNEAKIISGDDDVKGETGTVTGKHGGVEHILIDFDWDTLEEITPGDKILIKAYGVGLKLLEYPEIKVINLSPRLLKAMHIKEEKNQLHVPVAHKVPARIMGSGLGANNTYRGDYDIQLFDKKIVEEYGLEDLRLGDIVAIENAAHAYGRMYMTGAISIGIVTHTDCVTAGHGPGVTTLMTSKNGNIIPKIDKSANIAKLLELREDSGT